MCVCIYMRIFTGNVWKGICLTVRSGYWLSSELVEWGKGTRNFDFYLNFILFESFREIMYCFYFKFQKLKWENKRRKWSNTDPQSMKKRGSFPGKSNPPRTFKVTFCFCLLLVGYCTSLGTLGFSPSPNRCSVRLLQIAFRGGPVGVFVPASRQEKRLPSGRRKCSATEKARLL